jgi:1,4-alpha-glucan branching enzyme
VDGGQPTDRIGLEQWLTDADLRYFLVDARQLQSSPPAYERHSPCEPHWVNGNGSSVPAPLALFARDFESTARVWQHDAGYPGDPVYLEFHRKQGDSGLRYWRITDRRLALAQKQPYVPEWAFAQVSAQAAHFVQVLRERLREHRQRTGEAGVVVAAFDTELFGHWWFEGPQWVYELLRRLAATDDIALTTCGEYLRQNPPQHTVQLRESSWGDGGDHRVWRQPGARQLWRNVYQAERDLQSLGARVKDNSRDKHLSRLLRQCGRELLLLQASDWPFMIGTGNTADHAQHRATLHYDNFQHCRGMAERYLAGEAIAEAEWQRLGELEQQDALFPALDMRLFWDEPRRVENKETHVFPSSRMA